MSIDGPNSEDPAVIGAAVRRLATDSHLILTGAAAGGPDDHREALDDLLRRIEDLQQLLGRNRPGENRLHSVRIWLDNLQRQALIVRQMADLRARVERLEHKAPEDAGGAGS